MASFWRCTKCGRTSGGTQKPLAGSCVKGGGHSWSHADTMSAPTAYICGKCGVRTSSTTRPMDRPCSKGGKCAWRKV